MSTTATLTDDVFSAFLKCRYKAHLKLKATAGEPSEYQQLQARLAAEFRLAARQALVRTRDPATVVVSPPSLADALQSRPALILDVPVADADGSCRIDALERGPTGAYTPILFAPHQGVATDDRMRLAFGASVLARVQGSQPDVGRVVHGLGFKASRVSLPVLLASTCESVGQIRALQQSATPPPLVLNRHCPECDFCRSCRAAAVEKDDLSLLRGLSSKEIAGLNNRGIFTVTQFAHTFRPRKARKKETGGARKHHQSLQALAIRDNTVYVSERPLLPTTAVRIYLDVEGVPDADFYYLVGLVICDGGAKRECNFWANGPEDEGCVWEEFLRTIASLGEFTVFHYGSYETQYFGKMAQRHGGDPELLRKIEANSVNVLSLIYSRVYFPVYGNDLKSVASHLGFRWTADDASGLQAIVWRKAWEASSDERLRGTLIAYNREDCLALERIVAFLLVVAADTWGTSSATHRIAAVEDIKQGACRNYGNKSFFFPELARITKCSYFDYQRKRILFRTSPLLKKYVRPKANKRRKKYRANKLVACSTPANCPRCNADDLKVSKRYSKTVLDLKVTRSGIKRWVTIYTTGSYKCKSCNAPFLPDDYLAHTATKYGHTLRAWAVYTTVALRQTNENVVESLDDLFGYGIRPGAVSDFRKKIAEYYAPTYAALLQKLKSGHVIHADETKVSIRGRSTNGYVWVFANPETAVYIYAATREGDTARDTLDGFPGVLVSDFYSAYDSLPCTQQKCLIHLVRDFNDDLFKNPFNEELQQVGRDFTRLLQTIVETVDKCGLKRSHLAKHRTGVDRFFHQLSCVEYRSEVAEYYRKRLTKNKDKLFAFLDRDGVPWNNNNGENAIKRFVVLRKVLGTAFSEDGIKDYLVLLSISQTLRYRNLSFWKFLLSGETDLAAYTAKCLRASDPRRAIAPSIAAYAMGSPADRGGSAD